MEKLTNLEINKEDLDRMKAYCQIFEKNIRLMKEELDDQD